MAGKDSDSIPPYLIEVNGKSGMPVDPAALHRDGIRLEHVRGPEYVLYSDGKTIPIIIEERDRQKVRVTSGHRTFDVRINDHRDQLLAAWGVKESDSAVGGSVKAPMPGLVLEVQVENGDMVDKGANLLVLEAMKMENEIRSTAEGTITKIHVQKGDAVQKGQVLVEFAPSS